MKKPMIAVLAVIILLTAGILWYVWPDLDGYPDVWPCGIVPSEFRWIVESNFLNEVGCNGDILVKNELTDSGRTVTKYDYYSNVLSKFSYPFQSVDAKYDFEAGGIIHLLGDRYLVILDDNNVVGRTENGNDLSFLLYDSNGNLLWEYNIAGEDQYHTPVYHTMAVEDGYYLWLKDSYMDASYEVIRLDSSGREVFVKELDMSVLAGDGSSLNLLGYLTFENGFFSGWITERDTVDRFVTLDMELNVLSITERERPLPSIGTIDGEAVRYGLSDNGFVGEGILEAYPYGTPEMVLDYGDFYLILSWQNTGINHNYQGSPILGSRPMCTQHIYAAFDKSGELLWIGTVDSTRNS